MASLSRLEKLKILADAAKYDASCSSSGSTTRDSRGGKGAGSSEGMGICHAYTPDGRCISLLKILMTNYCMFDCRFCVNRISSNVQRARFMPEDLARLTIDFYKRNYIEGLFLSSGIIKSPDYTMEQLIEVARILRVREDFRGYIHLKTIPDADPLLLAEAGRLADRVSINVELPTRSGLAKFAPEKDETRIRDAMASTRDQIIGWKQERKRIKSAPRFAPAGQSTQMILGADGASDSDVLRSSTDLYGSYRLKRVYYSAFSPIPDASKDLPLQRPPLMREHRVYQADWLWRFYGFGLQDLDTAMEGGMLPLDIDPKLSWALQRRDLFPIDVNSAAKEQLLRVPGLGTKSVGSILSARRHGRLRLADIGKLCRNISKIRPFIVTQDWRPTAILDREGLRGILAPKPKQLELAL